ncbi:MAG TPA: protealysin inhibitor emfourin [Chloroflexota bacterium]
MRLRLSAEGGFAAVPGLRRPVTVDLDDLPESDARAVRELVEGCDFFSLPDRIAAPAGAADYREYTITAENGDQQHTVRVPEIGAPPELLSLIDKLLLLSS